MDVDSTGGGMSRKRFTLRLTKEFLSDIKIDFMEACLDFNKKSNYKISIRQEKETGDIVTIFYTKDSVRAFKEEFKNTLRFF